MTKKAVEKLHKQTGLYPKDAQVIELHDCFSANELITYEALGLCPVGELLICGVVDVKSVVLTTVVHLDYG